MSLQWISVSDQLQNGIKLINAISFAKFKLLLKHITQQQTDELFTVEDLKKLQDLLQLSETDVQLLIQCIVYILKQANKVLLKPTVLQRQLVEQLQFAGDKAEEFVQIWSIETKKDFGDFDTRLKLTNLSWQLNLQTASTFCGKQAEPLARLQLDLHAPGDAETINEPLVLELNEEELTHLYNTLENIQVKLDNVHAACN